MKKSLIIDKILILLATSALTACVDSLFDGSSQLGNDPNAVSFGMSVKEQPDMKIQLSTRSDSPASSGAAEGVAPPSDIRLLEGYNPYSLKMQCMTLPFVGIHKGAVKASAPEAQAAEQDTRAAWADRVISGENSDEYFHDSLTVWGYTRDAATTIFDKTLVQRTSHWRTSGHWPFGETGPMRFYAVAPSLENINMSVADADFSTPPVLTYTLPEEAKDMCDLLYGESGDIDIPSFGTKEENEGHDNKKVNLQFQHILTAVRFAQGYIREGITVKRVSIRNVKSKATFFPATMDEVTDTKGKWSGQETPQNFTMYANSAGDGDTHTTPTENTYINDSVFYMLPQTVPSGVELEVVIEAKPKYSYDGTELTEYSGSAVQEHTLRCSLAGDVWKKGYTVTYLLTVGEVADGYYFVAETPAENAHSDLLGSHGFTLHSYRMYVDKENDQDITTHGVNWKVAGYYSDAGCATPFDGSDASKAPSWLPYGVTGNNSGTSGVYAGGDGGTVSYSLSAQEATKSGNHAENLKKNSDDSEHKADKWDLSVTTPNGVTKAYETANCYIVNRRGSYVFPLVYGNKSESDDTEEAGCFVDHTGEVISHGKIEDQIKAKNPAADTYVSIDDTHRKRTEYTWNITTGGNSSPVSLRAVLVWQDYNGLVKDVNIQPGAEKLYFFVDYSTPGNAVVALQARKITTYQVEQTTDNWVLDTSQGESGYDLGAWETLWTWHIWMTDEVYPNFSSSTDGATNTQYLNNNASDGNGSYKGSHTVELTNWGTNGSNGTTNTILPVNLGWVPQEMEFKYYSKREVYVKLQQVEPETGGRTVVVPIVQHARQPLVRGQGTFYQWGRPTALPGHNWPDDANPKTVRTIYRNTTDFTDFTVENITHPYDVIAQPTKLFRRSDQMVTWLSTDADYAYWGNGSTKTVYDPCPPGFQVPAISVFTGFSMTGVTAGSNTDNAKKLNMWDDAGENFYGGYFYVEPHVGTAADYHIPDADRYDQTVYMPATGQYQATKGVGSQLSSSVAPNNNYIETSPGTVWTYGQDGDHLHGQALNLYPVYDRVHSTKPAIELPRKVNISTACAIRPVAK